MRTKAQARRGLVVYFTIVIIVSALLEGWIIAHGGLGGPARWFVLPLMYTPALACIVTRIVGREGFGDVSFRWGGWAGTRAALSAWLLPVVVGLVAYGIAWASGLAGFGAPSAGKLASISNPVVRLLALIPIALTTGTIMSCISAFGEELGWRGYMVPRLVDAEVPRADLVSGLVWCTWHVPLILWGGYAVGKYPALSVALFFLTILPVALLYFRWRMASGSLWPTVIAHGAWNVVIQGVFDPFAHGAGATIWIGESGVLTAATMWLLFFVMHRAKWAGTAAEDARKD